MDDEELDIVVAQMYDFSRRHVSGVSPEGLKRSLMEIPMPERLEFIMDVCLAISASSRRRF